MAPGKDIDERCRDCEKNGKCSNDDKYTCLISGMKKREEQEGGFYLGLREIDRIKRENKRKETHDGG